MGWISSLRESLGSWISRIFKKKRAKIGLYGPPNAGKTTLANRILHDWGGEEIALAASHPFHMRLAGL